MNLSFKKNASYLIVWLLSLGFIVLTNVVSAANTLPEISDGKITLTEDVELTEKYVVSEGETVTIDLDGHTLQGAIGDYAIANSGVVTIMDSGSTKGKILCLTELPQEASCIFNENTMYINGITVNSKFTTIKNQPNSTLEMESSIVNASQETAFLNYGNATINNSYLSTGTTLTSAVYVTSTSTTGSNLNITNSTLDGKYGLKYKKTKGAKKLNLTNVKIKNGVHSSFLTNPYKLTVTVNGDNETGAGGLIFLTGNAKPGTTVTLTENTEKTLRIPEGVTVIVPENITLGVASNLTVKGNLKVNGKLKNANVYNETTKTYYKSLGGALDKVKVGDNIVLQNDVSGTGFKTKVNSDFTLDLNGKKITGDITNVANGKLTIKDSSDSKTGTFDGLITNNGNLMIESGNYTIAPVTGTDAETRLTGGVYPVENVIDSNIPANMELSDNGDGTYSLIYKKADYSAVKDALTKAEAIDESLYTEDSLKKLDEAINAVVEGKKIDEQAEVDAMATTILKAIDELVIITIPDTADHIMIYVTLGLISLVVMTAIYYNRKKLFN